MTNYQDQLRTLGASSLADHRQALARKHQEQPFYRRAQTLRAVNGLTYRESIARAIDEAHAEALGDEQLLRWDARIWDRETVSQCGYHRARRYVLNDDHAEALAMNERMDAERDAPAKFVQVMAEVARLQRSLSRARRAENAAMDAFLAARSAMHEMIDYRKSVEEDITRLAREAASGPLSATETDEPAARGVGEGSEGSDAQSGSEPVRWAPGMSFRWIGPITGRVRTGRLVRKVNDTQWHVEIDRLTGTGSFVCMLREAQLLSALD